MRLNCYGQSSDIDTICLRGYDSPLASESPGDEARERSRNELEEDAVCLPIGAEGSNLVGLIRGLRPVPLGFLGMIALVFLLERELARNELRFSSVTRLAWKFSAQAARKDAKRAEILCFGSSLIKFGLVPSVLESKTGRSAFNIATPAGKLSTTYYVLKRALDAGAHPTAVIMDAVDRPIPVSVRDERHVSIWSSLREWSELLTIPESLELAFQARDATFAGESVLFKTLKSFKCRAEVWLAIRKLIELGPESGKVDFRVLSVLRNWNFNKGAFVLCSNLKIDPNAAETITPRPPVARELKDGYWLENRLARYYARRLLDLAAARKIQVFLVMPPLPSLELANQDASGIALYYKRRAARWMERYPNVTVIDGRDSEYDPTAFSDEIHMSYKGVVTFSRDLGTIVAARLGESSAGTRWVAMPKYEYRPPDVFVEDHDMSRLALYNPVEYRELRDAPMMATRVDTDLGRK